jgi:predicted aspartyl protease
MDLRLWDRAHQDVLDALDLSDELSDLSGRTCLLFMWLIDLPFGENVYSTDICEAQADHIAKWLQASKRKISDFSGGISQICTEYAIARLTAQANSGANITHHRVLPLQVLDQTCDAIADTGSDENAMSMATAQKLGLEIQNSRRTIVLANGRSFTSIGTATAVCSFARDELAAPQPVEFNIFPQLAAPIVIGKEFLDATETLTTHRHRLVKRRCQPGHVQRVLHINRPKTHMDCLIDGSPVQAHVDTGAEMNLISTAYAKKHFPKNRIRSVDDKVQLADGTVVRIRKAVDAEFSPTVNADVSMRQTFYLLDELTSTALLGENLLYSIDVFNNHGKDFSQRTLAAEDISLNLITWLRKRQQRMLSSLSKDAKADRTFHQVLADADAAELHRRELADRKIAALATSDKRLAEDAEDARRRAYEVERARCVAVHIS